MILKRAFLTFIITISLFGCYKVNGPKKPNNLISKDKMVDILIEIRLMSSATGVNQSKLYSKGISSYEYIYKKFEIDSAQLAQSNDYYAFYVDDYDEIYDKVRDSLQALKTFYDKLKEEEERERIKQDSIKAAIKDSLASQPVDSLKLKIERDSLKQINQNNKTEEGLIPPVSDTQIQVD